MEYVDKVVQLQDRTLQATCSDRPRTVAEQGYCSGKAGEFLSCPVTPRRVRAQSYVDSIEDDSVAGWL